MFKNFKFQVENRSNVASMTLVKNQVESVGSAVAAMSDFHLLLYLSSQVPIVKIVPMGVTYK